jgi:hypothetical protein
VSEQHGQDGDAHLTFYDPTSKLSFVWDGKHGNTVAVSEGGYGEPVIDTFEIDFGRVGWGEPEVTAVLAVNMFEQACRRYIEQRPGEADVKALAEALHLIVCRKTRDPEFDLFHDHETVARALIKQAGLRGPRR